MKKLIVLFVLFPMFSFSQMLLENVKSECLHEKEKESSDCYETLKGSKIYIENNNIVFDVIVSKESFKIVDSYIVESGETFYDIDYNGSIRTVFKHNYEDGTFGIFIFGGNNFLVYK